METSKFVSDEKLDMTGVSEFSPEIDYDDVVEFFVRARGMDEDRAQHVLDIIVNVYPEEFFAHILQRRNDQIVSRAVCTRMSDDTGNFYFSGDKDFFDKPIITKMVAVLKEKRIENVNAFLTENTLTQEENHLKLGFINHGEVSRYEKEI